MNKLCLNRNDLFFLGAVLALLILARASSYILFHTLVEIFSICIAFTLFLIGWTARKLAKNSAFTFISISCFFIGSVDLLHTLAFKGMNLLPHLSTNQPTQLWIVARFLQTLSFVCLAINCKKQFKDSHVFVAFLLVTTALCASILYFPIFPDCYIENVGLTPFKILCEYIFCLFLVFAWIKIRKSSVFDESERRMILWSIVFTILSELCFTLYIDVYGAFNMLGHFFKIISFFFIYKGLVVTALVTPYQSIFYSLSLERQKIQEKFSAIMELSPDIISIIDTNGMLVYNSPACLKVHGFTPEEMVGKDTTNWIHPDDLANVQTTLAKLFSNPNDSQTVIYRYKHKNGSYTWMEACAINQLANKHIEGLIVLSRDISIRKKQEEEIEQAKNDAIRANQAKSIFIANISHEIRTPLNAIIGMTEILEETQLNQEQTSYTQTIQKAGNSLLEIINNVLDLSQIESGLLKTKEENFLLRELIQTVFQIIQKPLIDKNLKFELIIDDRIPNAFIANCFFIKRTLINLLYNAVKFSEKGTITLHLELLEMTKHSSTITFKIIDEGIGISEEQLSQLFKRFQQLDSSLTKRFGGSGLGLSLCKEMIEQMSGSIGVQPNHPCGSCFFFTINIKHRNHESSSILEPQQQEQTPLVLETPLTIMLADDSEENRQLIELYLKKQPTLIRFAKNGKEALDLFQAENFDLIFMDIQMPVMDGLTATQQIRTWEKEHKRTPVTIIALSAYAMQSDYEKAIESGCNYHLSKPIRKATLLQLIHDITKKN